MRYRSGNRLCYQSLQVAMGLKCGFGLFDSSNNDLLLGHISHITGATKTRNKGA